MRQCGTVLLLSDWLKLLLAWIGKLRARGLCGMHYVAIMCDYEFAPASAVLLPVPPATFGAK